MKEDLLKVLFGFTIIALIAMTMLWWRDVAIAEKIVYRSKVTTVVDTTEAEAINEMWPKAVEDIIDSLSAIEPDTVYQVKEAEPGLAAPDTVYQAEVASPWSEMILRLVFKPPELSFTTGFNDTAIIRRLVYSDIPWGFMVYPGDQGQMMVQPIEPPPSPIARSGYNWGVGLAWPGWIVPAVFGEYYVGIGRIRFTGLINVSTVNMNVGLYFRWN